MSTVEPTDLTPAAEPSDELSLTKQPAAEQPVAEQPATEQSAAEQPAADLPTADAPPAEGVAPAARPKRLLLRASGAVLAAVLLGVGIGEVILNVAYDDRPVQAAAPAAPSASPSAAFGAKSNGNHFGSLRDLLLPIPSGFDPGPDNGAFGNDNEYGPEQLDKRFRAYLDEVPDKYKDRAKAAWESLHFKASGVRTFQSHKNDLEIDLTLDQFNQQAISQETELYGAMVDDTGLFRQGPGVAGHPAARCVLPPLDAGDQLDFMHCVSAEGDLMVTLDASGVAPLDQNKVVDLFRQQLDRLARPGASV
ncbi:hypothetical protein ACGFX4_08645 [Kitasatospora sp. NPDC048365]|uniref:hypothetical protein n=1 Tax=Kitasatospora sp. NPDC048365 TaxID=3364050 RepID=UPI00370F8134